MGVHRTTLFDEVEARLTDIKRLFTQLAEQAAPERPGAVLPKPDRIEMARMMLYSRALLEQEVAADLFADPALNILMTLYVAGGEGQPVSTSAACSAAAVPTTTALRWINALAARRMIDKRSLPSDRRFTYLELTPQTQAALDRYFDLILDRASKQQQT